MTVTPRIELPKRLSEMRRRLSAGFAAGLLLAMSKTAVSAEAPWPTKPIRLIVPGGPGGVVDVRAR